MGIDDKSSRPRLCSEVADGVTRNLVCLFREPDAGNLPVRFDEREQETELRQTGLRRVMRKHPNSHREAKATAPALDSTRRYTHNNHRQKRRTRVSAPHSPCYSIGLIAPISQALPARPGAAEL
jgi:hypothetical protein